MCVRETYYKPYISNCDDLTNTNPLQVIFEAIPVDSGDSSRRFRGYVGLDELSFTPSKECGAFCTFEGGTCGWTQDSNDDFDWTLVSHG